MSIRTGMMNGKFRVGILALIGTVVLAGVVGSAMSHDDSSSTLGLCTLVCVSLLALLHQSTANKLDTTANKVDIVAKETEAQTEIITQVKRQTNGLTKELVKKSEKIAFEAGKEVGVEEGKHNGK